ncbi:sigma 54-interacting transcriptional regulator [Marinithermus hydrothermalis]|uniref:Magnesium protoporphyrin chelatase putative n=1 Tax=Marinithermus hydrothermalis (strain DSM 14884 / JCM 11576 / T1) TaxID=869210 RepID=F2NKK3_MARHT|nr:sigma 54-interacting transcriptional regulator [Marinithermus hydrothermalis]AEB12663.1 magnesium protoporphyrin chelatase putative [Marinithermus hydrothermalis DSM 14884]
MKPQTLGELKRAYPLEKLRRSVKDEARENLIAKLRRGDPLFPGIHGYEETVVPHLVNAILARHNFILLGLRGQAKSRLLRALIDLLDPEIPALPTEIRDNPLHPLSAEGRRLLAEAGDDAPIVWVPADERYVEKLATPDTTVADLIGDVDPIKAARRGTGLGDLEAVHYGLLPRANRGIFAVNELADLAPKVQVALFNILQEGDVQIKGYPVRLPLDVWLVFTANPQDYTARGKIVTPLKDRIGSEIRTHYPRTLEEGLKITLQEAWTEREESLLVPPFVAAGVEAVAFAAREDKRVDQTSGVSQRVSISLLELVASNAERRAIRYGERPVARPLDVYFGLPAVTGKLELEYEGELVGAERIARELVLKAFGQAFGAYARSLPTDEVVAWFEEGNLLRLPEGPARAVVEAMGPVPGLVAAARSLAGSDQPELLAAAGEFVLEGLAGRRKIARGEETYSAALGEHPQWGN